MLRPARLVLLPSLLALAACASTHAPVDTSPVAEPEPAPVVAPVAAVVEAPLPAIAPASWLAGDAPVAAAALGALQLPPDCATQSDDATLTVRCRESSVLVELQDASAAPSDLDSMERETIQLLSQAGAKALLMGNPYCRVGETEAKCSFIEARSSDGLIGTAYTAVGADGDRAFTLRCLYLANDPGELELAVPACRQLLDFG